MSELYKRYVDVIALMRKDRQMIPQKLVWDNGRTYEIDKIRNVEQRASQVGGSGIRYEIFVCGQMRYLFYEKDRWFIESTQP